MSPGVTLAVLALPPPPLQAASESNPAPRAQPSERRESFMAGKPIVAAVLWQASAFCRRFRARDAGVARGVESSEAEARRRSPKTKLAVIGATQAAQPTICRTSPRPQEKGPRCEHYGNFVPIV